MLLHSLVFGPSNVALLSVYWGFIKHKKMYLFEQGCKPGPFFENIFKCAVTYRPNFLCFDNLPFLVRLHLYISLVQLLKEY